MSMKKSTAALGLSILLTTSTFTLYAAEGVNEGIRRAARAIVAKMTACISKARDHERGFLAALGTDSEFFDEFALYCQDKQNPKNIIAVMQGCARLGLWPMVLEFGAALRRLRTHTLSIETHILLAKAHHHIGDAFQTRRQLERALVSYPRSRKLRRLYYQVNKPASKKQHVSDWQQMTRIAERSDCLWRGEILARAIEHYTASRDAKEAVIDGTNTATIERKLAAAGSLPAWYANDKYQYRNGYLRSNGKLVCVNERYGVAELTGTEGRIPALSACLFDEKLLDRAAGASPEALQAIAIIASLPIERAATKKGVERATMALKKLSDGVLRARVLTHVIEHLRCHVIESKDFHAALQHIAAHSTGLIRGRALWALGWTDSPMPPLSEEDKRVLRRWPWQEKQTVATIRPLLVHTKS